MSEKEKSVPSTGVETADAEAEGALRRRGDDVLVASSARRHTGEDELQGAGTKNNAILTMAKEISPKRTRRFSIDMI